MIRTLMAAALALVCAAPASAAPAVSATCASLPAILASAKGGETITLKNQTCEQITIKKTVLPKSQVTINAGGSTVRGLLIYGQNIRWRGGRIVAPKGVDGKATDVYGLLIRNTKNVRVDGVTFGLSRKAVVTDTADNVTISDNRFDGYGEDGIISSATTRLTIERNRFTNVVGLATTCTTPISVLRGLSAAACKAQLGTWKDGFHADAVQLRNGVKKAVIRNNFISGKTQGITQMDTTGDAPLEDVLVAGNEVWGEIHHISLGGTGCIDCRIERNKVRRFPGAAQWKAVIRNGPARRCGNDVQDEKSDGGC